MDKQILELIEAIESNLTNDSRFVFQNPGDASDYKVGGSVFVTYLNNQGVGDFNIFGGSVVPDNSLGDPRDLYFKSDGSIYKKGATTWSLKVTGASVTLPTRIKINAGTTIPKVLLPGVDFFSANKEPTVIQKIPVIGSVIGMTTNGASTIYNLIYTSSAMTTLSSVEVVGNDNGGVFNEDTWVTVG